MKTFGDRAGKRTIEQRRAEVLKRATAAQNRYSIGGVKKEGRNAPKAVTLPRVDLRPVED